MFDLAMMTAPASRSFLTRNASSGGTQPASAREHCVAQIRKLLKPAAGATEFHRRYAEALQQSPDVVVAHGKAMRALERAKAL